MVISLDEENKNAVLSLRQTEILAKLQPLTSEIDANTDSSYVCFFLRFVYCLTSFQNICPYLSSGIWPVHARVYPRLTLHWFHPRSPFGRSQHAIQVRVSLSRTHLEPFSTTF